MKHKKSMKSMMQMAGIKANLMMEIGEDMVDLMMKARQYKRLNKK